MGAASKIPSGALSLNDQLADSVIRHGVYLQRLSNQEVREIMAMINKDIAPDLKRQLQDRLDKIAARGFDTGPATTKRLGNMIDGLDGLMSDGMKQIQGKVFNDMYDLAQHEAGFTASAIETTFPLGFEVDMPSVPLLRAAVNSQPMQGALLKDWFNTLLDSSQRNVERAVRIGIVEGQTTEQIVTRVLGTPGNNYADGVLQGTRRGVAMLVRGAASFVTNVARESIYAENADLVKGVQWVATLDSVTCLICGGLDGQQFEPGTGSRPPIHGNCRCTTTPVIKSFKELGIDGKELGESTRASFNGQVPETVSYGDWLGKQSAAFQDEALGPSRGKLFRNGDLSVDQFVDNGRTLTLAQLQKAEPEAFAKSGL